MNLCIFTGSNSVFTCACMRWKKYCLFIWPYDKRMSLSFLAPAIFLSFHVGTCWHKNESSTPCTLSIVSAWHSHQFSTRISPFFPLRNFCMCVCVCVLNSAWASMQAAHISGFHYKAPQSFFSWSSLPNPAYTSYTSLCGYTVSATTWHEQETGSHDGPLHRPHSVSLYDFLNVFMCHTSSHRCTTMRDSYCQYRY